MSIFITTDGSHSIMSEAFGVSYHSKHGAIQETQHVFIEAALRFKAQQTAEKLRILEIGFGTGLNAFMTFLACEQNDWYVEYCTYEAYPITPEQAHTLNYVEALNAQLYAPVFTDLHNLAWHKTTPLSSRMSFIKIQDNFLNIDYQEVFDIIYFDAFAPQAQPELWDTQMMTKMYNALKNNGVLTTYCAQGQFRRNLKAVGFSVEKLPGPPFKREMTRALKHNN